MTSDEPQGLQQEDSRMEIAALIPGFETQGFGIGSIEQSDLVDELGVERFLEHILSVYPEADREAVAAAFVEGFSNPSAEDGSNPIVEFARQLSRNISYLATYRPSHAVLTDFQTRATTLEGEDHQKVILEAAKAINKSIAIKVVAAFYKTSLHSNTSLNGTSDLNNIARDLGVTAVQCRNLIDFFDSGSVSAFSGDDALELRFATIADRVLRIQSEHGNALVTPIFIPSNFPPEMKLDLIEDQLDFVEEAIEASDRIEAKKELEAQKEEALLYGPLIDALIEDIEALDKRVNGYLAGVGETSISRVERELRINTSISALVVRSCTNTPDAFKSISMITKKGYLKDVIKLFADAISMIERQEAVFRKRDPENLLGAGYKPKWDRGDGLPATKARHDSLVAVSEKYTVQREQLAPKFESTNTKNQRFVGQIETGKAALATALEQLNAIDPSECKRAELKARVTAIVEALPKFSTGEA